MITVLVLLTTVSCGEVETDQTMPGDVSQTEQEEEDAIRRDAEVYAEYEGVSVEEAIHRFELMNDSGELQAVIVENEESYAGSWIQHQPEYKFVFAFTKKLFAHIFDAHFDQGVVGIFRQLQVAVEDVNKQAILEGLSIGKTAPKQPQGRNLLLRYIVSLFSEFGNQA